MVSALKIGLCHGPLIVGRFCRKERDVTYPRIGAWLSGRMSELPERRMPTRFVLLFVLIFFVSLVLIGGVSETAQASRLPQPELPQDLPFPRSLVIPWQGGDEDSALDVGAAAMDHSGSDTETIRLIIDSDFGVDDVVAVSTLLSLDQGIADGSTPVDIKGLVTVAGVTNVDQAVTNALLLMEQYGLSSEDMRVVRGAEAPWKQTLSSSGKLIHGPDGLWWLADVSTDNGGPDEEHVLHNPVKFYCEKVNLSGATILALGPLTNIGDALETCPRKFKQATGLRLIILGGADGEGNQTPVSEYNFWQDPDAAQYVFETAKPKTIGDLPKLDITLIPQDTFVQYGITSEDIGRLATSPHAVANWLTFPYGPDSEYFEQVGPLPWYYGIQAGGDETVAIPVPDLVAAAYAVNRPVRRSALTIPAMVDVINDSKTSSLASGQSLIASSVEVNDPDYGTYYIGTNEQVLQYYGDPPISELADQVFANDTRFYPDLELLYPFFGPIYEAPPTNATVVTKIDPRTVRRYLRSTLGVPYSPRLGVTGAGIADQDPVVINESETQIYLPLVGSE